MIKKEKRFLIVGLGLIGGSYAKKLSSLGYYVNAIDIDENALKYAKENKIILNENLSNKELIQKADYIILCLYPLENLKWIKENKAYLNSNCLISDVSGVKSNSF